MLNVLATFWSEWRSLFEGVAWAAAIAVPIVLISLSFEPTAKERQLCSEAVNTALTTRDSIELERAKFIVEQLRGCRIRP
jgi:hypothetical protein